MGIIYNVTCSNKACRYHMSIREGAGMGSFRNIRIMEQRILNGEEDAPDTIKMLLQAGKHFNCNTTYLCPLCQEWINNNVPFIFEATHISPFGTIREYRLHYLNGKPQCSKCGTELIHIQNPRSSKTPCPKCGTDHMISRGTGYFD